MGKGTKILIVSILGSLVLVALFIFGINSLIESQNKTETADVSAPRQITTESDDLDYELNEEDIEVSETGSVEAVAVGSKEVSNGVFQKVENDLLFYKINETNYSIGLNSEKIALACTKQDLTNVKVLDFNAVTKVIATNPAEISKYLQDGTSIVVFANEGESGGYIGHTIAVSSENCK